MYDCSDVEDDYRPPASHDYDVTVETDPRLLQRAINRLLTQYKEEKRGPTVIIAQSTTLGKLNQALDP